MMAPKEERCSRSELKRLYKETKPEAGVFQIKNTINGRIFVDSVPNLKSMNGQQFMLETGSHMNPGLQQEWRQFGKEAFVFEVLEVLEQKEEDSGAPVTSPKDALKKLEEKWLEKLQPYGDQGYNERQLKK